jgi:predicted nuclease of restriction endonuclease-like (RecB) superfamily
MRFENLEVPDWNLKWNRADLWNKSGVSIVWYRDPMESKKYALLLEQIKTRVREARLRAAVAVNHELVLLYWHIGREILKRQGAEGWGTKVVGRLSRDLRREFPDMRGFASRNLNYMLAFARTWPELSILQMVSAKLTWSHNTALIDKLDDPVKREWYARQALGNGWSRPVLIHQIESDLYGRQGKAVTNFARTLPPAQSDLAVQVLKDPFALEFLGLSRDADERVMESGLIQRLQRFLLELGVGFAFVGRQVPLEVGGDEFFMDLLFYHLRLRCYVVVELKAGAFRPEHAGKMNFYLTAVDARMRHEDDRPSIGMILCRSKNKVVVEYSLQATGKPIGVASYTLERELPKELRGALPEADELERMLGGR